MPLQLTIKTLGDLFEALTKEIPFQQQLFNHDFLDRVKQFAPVYETLREMGFEDLALAVAPKHLILDQVEIETNFQMMESREQQMALRVQPLNLGFSRRFAYSGFVQNRIQLSVQKIAPEPGKIPPPNDSSD